MFTTFRNSWAYLFNNDEEVVVMVASILPVVALFQVFDGISAVTAGILRSIGKQFTGALLNLRCTIFLTLSGVIRSISDNWSHLAHTT